MSGVFSLKLTLGFSFAKFVRVKETLYKLKFLRNNILSMGQTNVYEG